MANPANKSAIDFAPAWLKLPEQNPEQRKQEISRHHHHIPSRSNSHPSQTQHLSHNYQGSPSNYHPSQSYRINPPPVRHQGPGHASQVRNGRNHKSFNGRLSQHVESRPPPVVDPRPPLTSPPVTRTVEEDFPCLSGGQGQQPNSTQTAQWRIKQSTPQQRALDDNVNANKLPNNKLLTSNMTGEVYRAHIKPVRRTNTIPITNGTSTPQTRQNGDSAPTLSSSVEKEKRLLHEMGWNEDEDDDGDDDCEIPEDPAQLQEIFMQAKAARERLLNKSKMQVLKPAIPNSLPPEDDLPSSSDNSDID